MLTAPAPADEAMPTHDRVRSIRSLLLVSARTAGLARTAAIVAAGATPVVVTVARDRQDLSGSLVVLAIVAGAAIGGVADDPAAEVLAPCPIPATVRTVARLAVTVIVVIAGVAATLLVCGAGPGLPSGWVDTLPEFAVSSSAALAVGLAARRRGEPFGAIAGISAGLALPLTLAALGFRWPTVLPTFVPGPTHVRWWLIVGVAGAIACHAGRDIARPTLFTWCKGSSR